MMLLLLVFRNPHPSFGAHVSGVEPAVRGTEADHESNSRPDLRQEAVP